MTPVISIILAPLYQLPTKQHPTMPGNIPTLKPPLFSLHFRQHERVGGAELKFGVACMEYLMSLAGFKPCHLSVVDLKFGVNVIKWYLAKSMAVVTHIQVPMVLSLIRSC